MSKKSMEETVEKEEAAHSGEQLELIDVLPENAKPIIAAARLYKKFQAARMAALDKETKQKQVVLNLIHEAKLQPLEGGKIKFEHDGVIISVTPRDELIKIKEKEEAA
jgi:hypothetical protein